MEEQKTLIHVKNKTLYCSMLLWAKDDSGWGHLTFFTFKVIVRQIPWQLADSQIKHIYDIWETVTISIWHFYCRCRENPENLIKLTCLEWKRGRASMRVVGNDESKCEGQPLQRNMCAPSVKGTVKACAKGGYRKELPPRLPPEQAFSSSHLLCGLVCVFYLFIKNNQQ